MELKWLEDFLALARCGSFSRAAEVRFVSQPAFSRRIKALEDWLGGSLFERGSVPLTLTRQGEDFFQTAILLVQQIHAARESFQSYLVPRDSEVRLGAGPGLLNSLLFDTVQTHFPSLSRLRLHLEDTSGNPSEEAEAIVQGRFDFIIQFTPHGSQNSAAVHANLSSKRIGSEQFFLYSSPHEEVPSDLIFYSAGTGLACLLTAPSRTVMKRLRAGAEVSCPYSAVNLIMRGLGLGWLPHSFALPYEQQGKIRRSELFQEMIMADIRLYRRSTPLAPALEALWNNLP